MTVTPTEPELYCPVCDYNLRGITSERCPECGAVTDREMLSKRHIPWVSRKRIGRVRAYLATWWHAIWRSNRLAAAAPFPRSMRDATLFRWITIVLASPAIYFAIESVRKPIQELADSGGLFHQRYASPSYPGLEGPASIAAKFEWPVWLGAALALVFLARAGRPRMPGPASAQAALESLRVSGYLAAPLVILTLPIALFWKTVTMLDSRSSQDTTLFALSIAGVCFVQLLVIVCALRVSRGEGPIGLLGTLTVVAGVVARWTLALVVAMAVPWVTGFVWLVWLSLRG